MLIETTIFIVSTSWLPCNYLLFCFFKTRIKDFLFLSVTVILDTQYLFNKALSGWLRLLTDSSVLDGTTGQTIIPAGIFYIFLSHLTT